MKDKIIEQINSMSNQELINKLDIEDSIIKVEDLRHFIIKSLREMDDATFERTVALEQWTNLIPILKELKNESV